MKPYPNNSLSTEQRIFNYRLSRVQRVMENAFGILANCFQVLLADLNIKDSAKVEDIVLACCALHNFLQVESGDLYVAGIADQEGPDQLTVPRRWRRDPDLQQASFPPTATGSAQA